LLQATPTATLDFGGMLPNKNSPNFWDTPDVACQIGYGEKLLYNQPAKINVLAEIVDPLTEIC
jgi:hypothetical protein